MATTTVIVPQELLDALDSGELSREQLHRLIAIEAEAIGLTFSEAIDGARRDTLPHDPIGSDLRLLITMIEDDTISHD